MKKKTKKEPDGAPAWLVTYSDLVMLLLTFFVLLLSMATTDPIKFRMVAHSMRRALGITGIIDSVDIAPQTINIAPKPESDLAQRVYKRIQGQLNQLKLNKDIILVWDRGTVILRVNSIVLFDEGRTEVSPKAYPLLRSVAALVSPLPLHLRVEGHTDNIGSEETNWDLSVARAVSVIKIFSRGELLPLERISAVGYGSQQPLVPNDSAENRALNRRVEFVLESIGPYTEEPPFLIDARRQAPF